jgi:hypothetical protein
MGIWNQQMRDQLRVLVGTAFCVTLLMAPTKIVQADNFAYMGTVAGEFGTLNLNTGVYSVLGNSGQTLAGMAVTNGQIFASSYHPTGKLFTVNPANGTLAPVGNTTAMVYDDFGSTTSGLYAIGTDAALYSINAATGAETYVGPTGLSFGTWRSLSTNSNTLYFANGPNLYTINRNTGAASLVGDMGGPQIGALLEEAGQLYGGTDSPTLKIATLNTGTGLATTGGRSEAASMIVTPFSASFDKQ